MEQLRRQHIAPDRYPQALLAILQDPTAPEVLRDYAVQHLGHWLSPRIESTQPNVFLADPTEPTEPNAISPSSPLQHDSAFLQRTLTKLNTLIADPDLAHTSIPGTTLMLLVDLHEGGPSTPQGQALAATLSELQPWFRSALQPGDHVSQVTRLSAVNAIAMLGLTEHRPAIRQYARDPATEPSLRLGSIAALGPLGQETDLASLQTLADGSSKYRFAATAALQTLQQKLNL